MLSPHFQGKEALRHVVETQAQGFIDSRESRLGPAMGLGSPQRKRSPDARIDSPTAGVIGEVFIRLRHRSRTSEAQRASFGMNTDGAALSGARQVNA